MNQNLDIFLAKVFTYFKYQAEKEGDAPNRLFSQILQQHVIPFDHAAKFIVHPTHMLKANLLVIGQGARVVFPHGLAKVDWH